jgi:hypothetical protein
MRYVYVRAYSEVYILAGDGTGYHPARSDLQKSETRLHTCGDTGLLSRYSCMMSQTHDIRSNALYVHINEGKRAPVSGERHSLPPDAPNMLKVKYCCREEDCF